MNNYVSDHVHHLFAGAKHQIEAGYAPCTVLAILSIRIQELVFALQESQHVYNKGDNPKTISNTHEAIDLPDRTLPTWRPGGLFTGSNSLSGVMEIDSEQILQLECSK